MNVVIDIGNTSTKLAVMDQYSIIEQERITPSSFQSQYLRLLKKYPTLSTTAVCAVGDFTDSMRTLIQQESTLFEIKSGILLPFKNLYQSQKTLGVDRMALVAAGIRLNTSVENITKTPYLIIDSGTCVTYDYINTEKEYLGGAISPGLRLRYESLHNFTANLPLLDPETGHELIGSTTVNSIHSGVINGLASEIDGFINQYTELNSNLQVLLTGGDSNLLATRLKNRFFAAPNLMLEGIQHLYAINKNL